MLDDGHLNLPGWTFFIANRCSSKSQWVAVPESLVCDRMLVFAILSNDVFLVYSLFLNYDSAFFRQIFHLKTNPSAISHPPVSGSFDAITQLANFTFGIIVTDTFSAFHSSHRIHRMVVKHVENLLGVQGSLRQGNLGLDFDFFGQDQSRTSKQCQNKVKDDDSESQITAPHDYSTRLPLRNDL